MMLLNGQSIASVRPTPQPCVSILVEFKNKFIARSHKKPSCFAKIPLNIILTL